MKSNVPLLSREEIVSEILNKRALAREFDESGLSLRQFSLSRGIDRSSLSSCVQKAQSKDSSVLLDRRHFNPGRSTTVLPVHIQWTKGYIANFPRVPLTVVVDELNKVAEREGWPQISYWSLKRAIGNQATDEMSVFRDEDNDFYQKHFPVGRRAISVPLQMVQIDATEAEVWCIDMNTGELFRPWMSAAIDCATRVALAVHVHRSEPNAVDVLRLLKEAMLPKKNKQRPWFGIFQGANTDNALIYKDATVGAAMLKLGVDWQHSPKGCSGANGKVERLFGTFTTRLFTKLPGYSGRPNAKKRTELQGAIPFPLFQGIVDRFIDTDYSARKHSELNMSPWEAWLENLDQVPNLIFDVKESSKAFQYPVSVEIRRGAFNLENRVYKESALSRLNGKTVAVMCDPDGLTKRLDVFLNGRLVCQAVRDDGDLADDLNEQRTERIIELRAMRKDAEAELAKVPAAEVFPTVKPKRGKKLKAQKSADLSSVQILPAEEAE
jgi:transposase InsO family protein